MATPQNDPPDTGDSSAPADPPPDTSTDSAVELSRSTSPADAAPPSTTQPPTTPQAQRQASVSDPDIRSCFICLLNSTETPDATWVNACPCTLEAHEDCMLRWISESETSGKKKLRCPACNGRIQVVEPWDPVVKIRDRFRRVYSKTSPLVLFSMIMGMGMAGSGFYGWMSMTIFAGANRTIRWLGLLKALHEQPLGPWWRWKEGYMVGFRFFLLNFIAPGLMLNRALPSLVSFITIPISFAYGATLVARDNMPSWPPSPAWALTLMPYVNLSYSSVYYEFFGSFERRLNRQLRGRGAATEEAPAQNAPVHNAPAQNAPAQNAPEQHEEIGIGAALWRLGNAVLNLFDGDDDAGGDGADDAPGGGGDVEVRLQLELVVEDEDERAEDQEAEALPVPQEPEPLPPVQGQDEQNDQDVFTARAAQAMQDELGAARVQPLPNQPPQNQNQNNHHHHHHNNNNNNNNQQVDENRPSTTLSDIVNGTVTQLLFPGISAGVGELLRLSLPRSWVTRPDNGRTTGLLQEKWGRSLIGGCLFIVLKDALNLYTKYRRVAIRKHRRVKNVERRRNRDPGQRRDRASQTPVT